MGRAAGLRDKGVADLFSNIVGERRGSDRQYPLEIWLATRQKNLLLAEQVFSVRGEIGELAPEDRYLIGQCYPLSAAGAFIEQAYTDIDAFKHHAFSRKFYADAAGYPEAGPPAFIIDLIEGTISSIDYNENPMMNTEEQVKFRSCEIPLEKLTEADLVNLLTSRNHLSGDSAL